MDHYRTDSTNFKSYPIDLKKTAKFLCHFDKQTQVIFFCFSLKKKNLRIFLAEFIIYLK